MSHETDESSRLYVYGIGHAEGVLPDGLTGLANAPVHAVTVGRLAAIVSDIAVDVVRPERRNLGAHQKVLTALAGSTDVLPMAFGMISDNAEAVRSLLADNAAVLSRELARIAGRVEMTVRLRWIDEDTFRVFVDRFPELRQRRDACFSGRREPSQVELLELGRTFEQLLGREREEKTALAMDILGGAAVEVKTVQPASERVIFDIGCLVNFAERGAFDSAVEALAGRLGDELLLDVRGPWPPYNFVNVAL